MIKRTCVFVLFLFALSSKAQKPQAGSLAFHTHELLAKIIKIDTIVLVENDYLTESSFPPERFKALCVRIKIVSKIKGDFNNIPKEILIELTRDEHNCFFDFKKDKVYRIYVSTFRYSSKSVRKKYQKKFLQLDCHNLPVMQ